ncbi:putative C6 transcription factor [Whalleya microplaca]|nr:putative C6 transcription factor [Whalleya microplaca]
MPRSLLDDDLKKYSCLICRQRKVRCDRRTPCSNCVKAEKQCSFIPPVRGKRKRTKPPKESLHAKLKRYEKLLKSYGARVEPSEDVNDSSSEAASQPDVEMDEDAGVRDPVQLDETKPKLIEKEDTSRYFDSTLWSMYNLGEKCQHPEVDSLGEAIDESNVHESQLFFETEHNSKVENLTSLLPSVQMVPTLREIYVDRVDPLMKILHLPTFWPSLTNALRHPEDISKSLGAVIFAFYLSTISTLEEGECHNLFGVPKSVMYSRYRHVTRQALVNAGFLSTSNLMTLRAYAIFMMSVRNSYQCDALFVLSGIAIRLARKMGLHRDGASLGFSPFETEMRRRLWWHLVHVDYRMADLLGTRPSMDLSCGDTKMPLNVDDEDLHPDMVDPPLERKVITSIAICLTRCEIIESLRKYSTICPGDVRWELLSSPNITIAKKDSVISQIEDQLEEKYLRYCDPSNLLHTFVSTMVRSSICKMRLFAHNPRRYANSPVKVPQSERDIVFTNAVKLLEYAALLHRGDPGLKKYMWLVGTIYLWNTILYVLIEVRHRRIGPEISRAWQLIEVILSHHPKVFDETTGAVYKALRMWTLEVWDDHVAATKSEGLPEPATPECINAIRHCQEQPIHSPSRVKDPMAGSRPVTRSSFGYNKAQSEGHDGNLLDFETRETCGFPNILSFESDPTEWLQWEQLLTEHGSFAQVDSMEIS